MCVFGNRWHPTVRAWPKTAMGRTKDRCQWKTNRQNTMKFASPFLICQLLELFSVCRICLCRLLAVICLNLLRFA